MTDASDHPLSSESKVRTMHHYCYGPGKFFQGRAAYFPWRPWAGIPDNLFPPAKDLRKIFGLANVQ